jgi:hypothetical protein
MRAELTLTFRLAAHVENRAVGLLGVARRPYQDPPRRHDLGRMDIECHECGALHWMAERISTSSKRSPKFGMCCNHGRVKLQALPEPPQPLRSFLMDGDIQAREFRENIRLYNSALSFTSLGVKPDTTLNNGGGPYVFRVHGVLYHLSGSLLPPRGMPPAYAQLYIHDPRTALTARIERNPTCRPDTMEALQTMLIASHRYAHIYRQAHEILATYPEADENATIRLRVTAQQDRRRYNLPTADEVAVIIPGDGTQATDSRDIILHRQNQTLQRVSDAHPAYPCLRYVLLFPHGEHGWYYEMREQDVGDRAPKRLSQTRYCAYRMQQRRNDFNTILRGGRLFQEWVVDMWASADQNRLNFLRKNQQKLRASLYSGLEDAIAGTDDNLDVDMNALGQRVILPSSYIGGPRHMQQRYQDAMAIARYYRKVDIFLTVTCNPKWPEITRELLAGQTAADRPDLVACVFEMKKNAILEDIYKNGIFGQTAAYVYVIEFQKRGLPHMHILIFLNGRWKLLTPPDVDSAIRATWPDPEREPLLFETVKNCMVHGPCGALNPRAPCMENGKCTKHFPKSFQPFTTMDHDGYPLYARPDDGRAYEVNGHMLDNTWIIPHNPHLSAKYDCHINVECAASISSIKYPFKYIHKGGDRAVLEVQHDEIKRYIDGRYISPPEGNWRIYHFGMHDQLPNVVRLQIHLPGQHMVTFDPTEDPAAIMERAATEQTTLTAFFAANSDLGELGTEARKLLYQEFPQKMVWKDDKKMWALRQRGFALGRMYFVSPTGGERLYLRTLLTVVKGPTSFTDLLTYQGVVYATFREACLARGLLEDDGEWQQCLRDASTMQTGTCLRHLFATLLLFCSPSRPELLWADFRQHICDDLARKLNTLGVLNPSEADVFDYGLHLLDKILRQSGKCLKEDFPSMPTSREDWDRYAVNPLLAEQFNYDRDAERAKATERVPQLNPEQRHAFDRITGSVRNRQGRLFFLNGPGGTGKTFVYNTVCHELRSAGLIVLCVASSGIASLLLNGGRTAHSLFKIPIDGLHEGSFCSIPKEGQLAGLLRVTSLIIWDEVTMQHRFAMEAVDRTCRDLRTDERPFGGITVVFGGDYQQILPVIVKGTREEVINATIQRSYLWRDIELLRLKQNMRLDRGQEELKFADWLLDVGHGRMLADDGTLQLLDSMICDDSTELINFIYPGVDSVPPPPPKYFLGRTILAPRNHDVAEINDKILDRMSGASRTYMSADSIEAEQGVDGPEEEPLPVELLRSLDASSLPPGELIWSSIEMMILSSLGELSLKIGCPLILLRNLSPSNGLCNGTRMVLLKMSDRVLEVRLIGGDHDGKIALIPRITVIPSSKSTGFAFTLRRRQFPVRLAFAMSVNKAQGQSVEFVGLDLRVPVFSHGQLYVALSRSTSSRRIKILLHENATERRTWNIVYPEVLLDT